MCDIDKIYPCASFGCSTPDCVEGVCEVTDFVYYVKISAVQAFMMTIRGPTTF